MFNLCDVLQESNPAVKQDLPIVMSPPPPPAAAAAAATSSAAATNLQHTHKSECNSLQLTVFCIAYSRK